MHYCSSFSRCEPVISVCAFHRAGALAAVIPVSFSTEDSTLRVLWKHQCLFIFICSEIDSHIRISKKYFLVSETLHTMSTNLEGQGKPISLYPLGNIASNSERQSLAWRKESRFSSGLYLQLKHFVFVILLGHILCFG